jgi:type VI secretion system secreted protein VgrG
MSNLSLSFGGGGAAGQLDVRHFSVVESLSEPFLVNILARSPSPDLHPGDYVGRDVTFSIDTGAQGVRSWTGIVLAFELAEVEDRGLSTYEITITPRLAILDHRVNNRIFQRKSAPDIVKDILSEWQVEHEARLFEDHKTLEYRVQYGESDLAFVSRMLSEAGISYFFESEGGATKLILSDQPHRADATRPALPYRSSDHDDTDGPHVRFIVGRKEIRHSAATIGDFDFRRPAYGLFHTAQRGESTAGHPILEQFVYRPGAGLAVSAGGAASDTPAADALSMARVDEHVGRLAARSALEGQRGLEVEMQSNVSWLAPGTAFIVTDHPKLDGKRLIVREARLTGQSNGSFAATAVARHTDTAVRPAPILRPVMPGMQSATVVGAPGEEIHTDEFGRVRVHFHWDREGQFDDKATCWLRVAEGWGGAGFGLLSIPRVGHEVLIDFVAGNPDEPLIVGRVYGGTTPPAIGLPGKSTRTGWHTRSTPDGEGFHEVTFDDKKGTELFFVRSEKDFLTVVQNEEEETVLRDRVGQIGVNLTSSITENDAVTASAWSAAMGKVEDIESIQHMGSATAASTLTLREMVPGKITLTTGGTMVQLLDDEIYVVADETLKINGKSVDIQGGPFVHVNPPAEGKVADAKKNEQEGHTVWFELLDKEQRPIANLECYVQSADGEASHVQKTDGQGRVLFNVDKPGEYDLVVGRKPEEAAAAEAAAPAAAAPAADAPAAAAPAAPSLAGNKTLKTNSEGLKLVRKSEGFFSKPYIDPVGIPTIGYGTIKYPDGRSVTMKDPAITEAQAEAFLRHEAKEKEDAVKKMVKVPLNENQFSALVSFSYNVGTGALQNSTLLKKLNSGDYDGAADEFGKWNKGTVTNKKTGKKEKVELKGLTTRRAAEKKLFETPPAAAKAATPAPAAAKAATPPTPAAKPAAPAAPAAANAAVQAPKAPAAPAAAAATPAADAATPAAKAAVPTPVTVGTTEAKATSRAQMTQHTVPLKTEVTSPKGDEKLTIEPGAHPGADPSMPSIKLKASAKLGGQPITEGTFRWQFWISGKYKTRMGDKDYNLLAGDARTQPDQEVEFKLAPPSVCGGDLMVKIQFEHPQLGTSLVQTIKGIKVQGKNPSKADIKALINELEPGMGWITFPIIEQESRYRQFKTPDQVLVGAPAGIGITQRDPEKDEWPAKLDPSQPNTFFPSMFWDWKENVRAGMKLLGQKRGYAKSHLDRLQKKHGLPQYSQGMLARETLRRYNGGSEYGASNGNWVIAPRTPADRVGYVDEVVGRMNASDIPAQYADISKKTFP